MRRGGPTRAPAFMPAAHHDVLTPAYDLLVRALLPEPRIREALLADTRLVPGHVVLDVGCGTGTLLLTLARQHPGVFATGIDPDPRILAIASRKARRQGRRLDLVQGSACALPSPDGSVDRVVTTLAVHHISTAEKLAFFREARRVLRPGGGVHVADFGPAHSRLMRWSQRLLEAVDGAATVADNLRGRVPELMREAGLSDVGERARFATVFGTICLWSGRRA